jgi:hypothetical protein
MVERVHGHRKNSVHDLDDQVVVRLHKAEAHAPPFTFRGNASESAQEIEAVEVVAVITARFPDAMRPDVEHACRDITRLMWHPSRLPLQR